MVSNMRQTFLWLSCSLHGINLAEYPTRECLLKSCGVPEWAERYVDWDYLKETADYNSYYSYY